jgi:hypothetical protein
MLRQIEAFLGHEKGLKKIEARMQVAAQQARFIQEFGAGHNAFPPTLQPAFLTMSRAKALFRDRALVKGGGGLNDVRPSIQKSRSVFIGD